MTHGFSYPNIGEKGHKSEQTSDDILLKFQIVRFNHFKEDSASIIRKLKKQDYVDLELAKDSRVRIFVSIGNKTVATVVESQMDELIPLLPCKVKIHNVNRLKPMMKTKDGERLLRYLDLHGLICER